MKYMILTMTILFSRTVLGQVSGTGFAIHSSGYIVTNHHVIEGQEQILVRGINGDNTKAYAATLVKFDKANDLAILKVNTALGKIPYGFKKTKQGVATKVYAYGYPLTYLLGDELKFTEGEINSNSGLANDPRWYQHTATLQSGNSGGPLFNKYGNLVGINNAGINNAYLKENFGTETTNINYTIKARYLLSLMEDLELKPAPNNGLSNLDIATQYKQIRKFVYVIVGSKEKINNNTTKSNTTPSSLHEIEFKWHTNLVEAVDKSIKENKPLLMFFTGSDWCGWCKRLQAEAFFKPEFENWAKKNVVLMELDFPRRTPQDETIRTQNMNMQRMFGVRGYPTIWFVNPTKNGEDINFGKIGSTGYVRGGAEAWIAAANKILATQP
jgi:protein disulfide-isomerase